MSLLERLRNWWRPQPARQVLRVQTAPQPLRLVVSEPVAEPVSRKARQRRRQGGHVPTQINIISG
jgi:hypothetical protein